MREEREIEVLERGLRSQIGDIEGGERRERGVTVEERNRAERYEV